MPRGKHARVVKARTAKQQAAARVFSAMTFGARASGNAMPSASWWIGLSREQLAERARVEQARMNLSKFGRLQGSPNQGE